MNRSWLPPLLALLLGAAAGLTYAWWINPVSYVDSPPSAMRADYQEDFLGLVAAAFAATGDLTRARARLDLFKLESAEDELQALAQQRMADPGAEAEAEALALLSAALGAQPAPTATAIEQTTGLPPTRSSSPTAAAISPPAPTATPGAPFELIERSSVCDPNLPAPLLQVQVLDAAGNGVPSVAIELLWDTGEDRFVTGLKPELGSGYADFEMQPETIYTLQLSGENVPVTGLQSPACEGELVGPFAGSLLLVFQQPAG